MLMKQFWKGFSDQFSRLRWKMTVSYFTVTVLALLLAEILMILGVSIRIVREARMTKAEIIKELSSSEFEGIDDRRLAEKLDINRLNISLGGYINIGSSYLSSTPPNISGLKEFISGFSTNVVNIKPIELGNFIINVSNTNILSIVYTDSQGKLIGSIPPRFQVNLPGAAQFDPSIIPGLEEPYAAALSGSQDYDQLIQRIDDNVLIGAVPIPDRVNPTETVGVLAFEHKSRLTEILQWREISRQIGFSLVVITGLAGVFGILFGFWNARFITSRLDRVTEVSQSWSEGDFSTLVDDPHQDELAQLSRTLNNMAVHMETLLEERQEISVLEERNRLARELHDSVKQQTFAASAQLAAGRSRLNQADEQARENFREAEKLIDSVRHELTDLIHELRPATLKGTGLASAVQAYLEEMEHQTGIPIDLRIRGERSLPLDIEQTLFRIIQGAMSNVARHSRADRAWVRMEYHPDRITVTIRDDGVGFNLRNQDFSVGLKSIQERVDLISGELEVHSRPHRGTTIFVDTPLDQSR